MFEVLEQQIIKKEECSHESEVTDITREDLEKQERRRKMRDRV